MNAKLKAGFALAALFVIGFLSGYLFSHTTQSPPYQGYPEEQSQISSDNSAPPARREELGQRRQDRMEQFDGDSVQLRELRKRFVERLRREKLQGPETFPAPRNLEQNVLGRIVKSMDDLSMEERWRVYQELLQYRKDVGDFLRENRNYEVNEIRQRYDTLISELSKLLREDQLKQIHQVIHPDSSRRLYQGNLRNPSPSMLKNGQEGRSFDRRRPENN